MSNKIKINSPQVLNYLEHKSSTMLISDIGIDTLLLNEIEFTAERVIKPEYIPEVQSVVTIQYLLFKNTDEYITFILRWS